MTFFYQRFQPLMALALKASSISILAVSIIFFATESYGQDNNKAIPGVIGFLLDEEESEKKLAWANYSNKVFMYNLESQVKTEVGPNTGAAAFSVAYNPTTNSILYDTESGTVVSYDLATNTGTTIATDLENAFGLAVDTETGKIYWSEFSAGEIWQMNADGSNKSMLVDVGGNPSGLAVDTVNNHIYYLTYNSTALYRIDLATGSNKTTIHSSLNGQGVAVAVDPAAEKLYYTIRGDDVFRSNLDGQNVETLITNQGAVQGMDIDVDSNKIYWIDVIAGTIRSADLNDGNNIQDITTLGGNGWHLTLAN